MGKINELRETLRNMKSGFQGPQSGGAITYKLNMFGMRVTGKSIWIYAMFPVFLIIAYAGCAISLYAFDTLLGIPEFSWINVVWWMIVLATGVVVFKGGD